MVKDDVFVNLHFPDAPSIKVVPPGPKAKELLDLQVKVDSKAVIYPLSCPTAWESAKGATLRDVDGNVYIDLFAGVGVVNVGHQNPFVLEALKTQASKLIHSLDFPTEKRLKMIQKLIEIAPGNLKNNSKVFFCSPAGTDAVESALKLARSFNKRPGIIAFEGGYHGQTFGAVSVTSKRGFRTGMPTGLPVSRVPYAYCYRCPLGKEYPECEMGCIDFIERLFKDPESGLVDIGAMIVEAIQGESGIVIPPDEFLQGLRRICDENSVVLIVDEIQAGFGRTGKMWACQHPGVTPDIMTMSKALGGIGLPNAGIIYRKDLDVWAPAAYVGTFRGNVLSCACGLAGIEYMESNNVVEYSESLGREVLRRLKDLEKDSKIIGEVRGRGLMLGIEFVEDKKTKKPFTEGVAKIQRKCFERGIMIWKGGHWANVIRFLPPLVITRELMGKALTVFEEEVKEVERSAL